MNEKIKDYEKKLTLLNTKYRFDESMMIKAIIKEYELHFETLGIKKGCKVKNKFGQIGIFSGFFWGYGYCKPLIKKITKSGNPHKTATVYCFSPEDIKKI